MRVVGYTHWTYQRFVKPRLPPVVRRIVSRGARSNVGRLLERVNSNYNFWRIQRPATRVLGPQYRRSRGYIEIDVTYACNLNCFYCNPSCEQAPTGEHLTVEQIRLFVEESIAAGYRWKRIRL